MKKLLLKSVAFRFLERAITVITSLLLTPFFLSILGSNDYGLWILILSIMGWFNVVDLGFPQAVQRQIVQALELKDHHRVNVVFSTGLVLFTALGLVSVGVLIGLTQVPAIFGVNAEDQLTLVNILLILSVKILWGFMMNPFHGFFSGLLRFDIDANLSSLNAIAKALLVFWFIPDLNIWGAVVATLIADIITNILKIFYAKRLFPSLRFKLSLASFEEIKSLFSYSKHLVINGIISTIGKKSGPILVTNLFDLPSLAIQSIAANLLMHANAFVGTVVGVFSPVFNKMVARKQHMEKIFIQTTTINIFVSTVLLVSLAIFGKVFILLWVGKEFEYAAYIMYFTIFSSIFISLTTCSNDILLAQANHKLLSVVSFCAIIFRLSLSVYLGLTFGLIGVAMGGAINSLIFHGYIRIALFRRYNNYKLAILYRRLFTSLFITFSLGFIGINILEQLNIDTWLEFIISATITLPIIIVVCWILLLDQSLKTMLFNLLIEKFKTKKSLK